MRVVGGSACDICPPLREIVRFRCEHSPAMYHGMRLSKHILTAALCLIVIATSVTSAVARGQMATGQMVQLCAGGQAVTVMMDAQGNPVDPAHPCPDCLAVAAALPPANVELGLANGHWVRAVVAPLPPVVASTPLAAMARGPPIFV